MIRPSFTLAGVNLNVRRGELAAVVGPVGLHPPDICHHRHRRHRRHHLHHRRHHRHITTHADRWAVVNRCSSAGCWATPSDLPPHPRVMVVRRLLSTRCGGRWATLHRCFLLLASFLPSSASSFLPSPPSCVPRLRRDRDRSVFIFLIYINGVSPLCGRFPLF